MKLLKRQVDLGPRPCVLFRVDDEAPLVAALPEGEHWAPIVSITQGQTARRSLKIN